MRSRVETKLWRLLGRGITGEQRKRLEYLLPGISAYFAFGTFVVIRKIADNGGKVPNELLT
jgi:hypothetical protein